MPATGLAEHLREGVFVKADKECLANPDGGRTEVAGWAKHGVDRVVTHRLCHIKLVQLLAFGSKQFGRVLQERFCVVSLQLSAGRNLFDNFYLTGFQEPGCFGTGRSSLAEVVPLRFLF